TTLFWIILIGFFISAVYSARDIQFHLGEPEIGLTADTEVLVSIPIEVDNQGFYNIGSFNLSTRISDNEGAEITEGHTFIPLIEQGKDVNARHNITLDIDSLLKNKPEYVFNDTEFVLHETIGLRLAEVIPVQASTNITVPWGGPLYNFSLGEIAYAVSNESYLTASVPISFANHAPFDLIGNIKIDVYNSTDALIGSGMTVLEVPQDTPYEGDIEFTVPVTAVTRNGYCEVHISTEVFHFGPLVIP
ncbi:MAG: hypothetical protein GWO20_04670, partial [Candidatus Korarchaeota archaeon]|nr:hypothetical protein [Candidatus Korarchaeota archaeon]